MGETGAGEVREGWGVGARKYLTICGKRGRPGEEGDILWEEWDI